MLHQLRFACVTTAKRRRCGKRFARLVTALQAARKTLGQQVLLLVNAHERDIVWRLSLLLFSFDFARQILNIYITVEKAFWRRKLGFVLGLFAVPRAHFTGNIGKKGEYAAATARLHS